MEETCRDELAGRAQSGREPPGASVARMVDCAAGAGERDGGSEPALGRLLINDGRASIMVR